MEKQIKNGWKYSMSMRIWREKKVFGPGIAQLLLGVEQWGSLHRAALEMDLAYSKAWKIIKETEETLGYPLTKREAGGKNGGGSVLTEQGRELLQKYQAFIREADKAVEVIFEKYF